MIGGAVCALLRQLHTVFGIQIHSKSWHQVVRVWVQTLLQEYLVCVKQHVSDKAPWHEQHVDRLPQPAWLPAAYKQ